MRDPFLFRGKERGLVLCQRKGAFYTASTKSGFPGWKLTFRQRKGRFLLRLRKKAVSFGGVQGNPSFP